MNSRCIFFKMRRCMFILIMMLIILSWIMLRLYYGQQLAKYILGRKILRNDDKNSGFGLFKDNESTEYGLFFPDNESTEYGLLVPDNESTEKGLLFPNNGSTGNGSSPLRENSTHDNVESSLKFIFINSYMRSGSTFLGRLVGFRSDVFYYYEPLHIVWKWKYLKGSKACDFNTKFCKYEHDALGPSLNFLSDVFNCRFENHSEKVNQKILSRLSGPKWNSFTNCVTQHTVVKGCLFTAQEQCLKTKNRVVKVLRMSLADAALLLPKHPNLVIVHLFRDPRGTFNSHIRTKWYPVEMESMDTFIEDTKANYERIRGDLMTGIKLKAKFPDRVNLVQYEDIYDNEEKAKNLYKWLGLNLLPDSDEFFRTHIHRKYNKTETSGYLSGPFMYRKSLSFKHVQIIDNECKEVIRMLGLKLYNTEEDLRDTEYNPIDGKLPFEL